MPPFPLSALMRPVEQLLQGASTTLALSATERHTLKKMLFGSLPRAYQISKVSPAVMADFNRSTLSGHGDIGLGPVEMAELQKDFPDEMHLFGDDKPYFAFLLCMRDGDRLRGGLRVFLPCEVADFDQILKVSASIGHVNLCLHCHAPATKMCNRCRIARYCSKECQSLHWKAHKPMCCKYM